MSSVSQVLLSVSCSLTSSGTIFAPPCVSDITPSHLFSASSVGWLLTHVPTLAIKLPWYLDPFDMCNMNVVPRDGPGDFSLDFAVLINSTELDLCSLNFSLYCFFCSDKQFKTESIKKKTLMFLSLSFLLLLWHILHYLAKTVAWVSYKA